MKKYYFPLAILAFGIISCESPQKVENAGSLVSDQADSIPSGIEQMNKNSFVTAIEQAHKKEIFESNQAIQFNLQLSFGGKTRFDGEITMTPNGDRIKLKDSSSTMIWDGKKAMIAPDTADEKGARFALFTWSYFFAAPYKLSDPGTKFEDLGNQVLNGKTYTASKLTFEGNVGDSPDDWYIIYKNDSSNLMVSMAYIVTAGGTSQAEAEEDPHAITYEAYTEIEGVPFATVWNFWTWNKEGELNKLLGNANLSNIRFIDMDEQMFSTTENSKPLS